MEGDEHAAGARTVAVDRAGQCLLAGAARAHQKDAGVGWRNLAGQLQHLNHLGIPRNEVPAGEAAALALAQNVALPFRSAPLEDAAHAQAQRLGAVERPAQQIHGPQPQSRRRPDAGSVAIHHGNRRLRGVFGKPAQNIHAVAAGELKIRQNQVVLSAAPQSNGVLHGCARGNRVPLAG